MSNVQRQIHFSVSVHRQARLRTCLPGLICLTLLVSPEQFKSPPDIKPEKGSIVVTESDGKPRWTAEWTMEPVVENGRRAVRFTESGHGRHSAFANREVQWS